MHIRLRKGLDVPLDGVPEQTIDDAAAVSSVAVLGPDYCGLKPGMEVHEGDRVRLGEPLFFDKRNPDVHFAAPGSGTVVAVNRGERRVLQSVVIRLEGDEQVEFDRYPSAALPDLDRQAARRNLLASGLWVALRTRPFSYVPNPDTVPRAIFVTAIDTNPLAADPAVVIASDANSFADGLQVVAALTDGAVYLCTAANSGIACPDGEPFRHAEFSGPHPAGLPGTHIHFLEPVHRDKVVWHIGYQDVMAIGRLFLSGRLPLERIIALGGPAVSKPRLLRTRLGANISEMLRGEIRQSRVRIVSGSVLSGHRAAGWGAYLGRYHDQVAVLQEGAPREFLSWMRPGFAKYSATRAFAAHLRRATGFGLTTSQNGSPRAMVSIGSFESVMPLDILPTPLLKALLVNDSDSARELGCMELAEEDLALCSFVCNGKYEYGPYLRNTLRDIEANG